MEVLAALFVIGIIVFFIWLFNREVDGATRTKEDVLNQTTNIKVNTAYSSGVLASTLPNNEMFYISDSDRACVIGPPGTGKTTFLVNQIFEWIKTEQSLVVIDIKPEIYTICKQRLEQAGYTSYIFNPINPVHKYNLIDDLYSLESIGELAAALIPASDSENAVFFESARDLLDAIINHLKSLKKFELIAPSLSDVYDFIVNYDNANAMLNDLNNSKNIHVKSIIKTLKMVADNERLMGSILATLTSNMRFLRYPSIRECLKGGDFNLSILMQPKTILFLQLEESHLQTIGSLFSVLIGHVFRFLIMNTDRAPVLCLFDEIGNAGVINGLIVKLNTIRSRKIPTWMYWQSMEQMQKYGSKSDEGANIILGACDYHMVFRLNDNETAKWFSDKIGTQEAIYRSVSSNESDGKTVSSSSDSIKLEAIIEPHELQQLGNNQTVSCYNGKSWKGRAVPYFEVERKEQEFKELEEKKAKEAFQEQLEQEQQRLHDLEAEERMRQRIDKTKAISKKMIQLSLENAKKGAESTKKAYIEVAKPEIEKAKIKLKNKLNL